MIDFCDENCKLNGIGHPVKNRLHALWYETSDIKLIYYDWKGVVVFFFH